LEVLRVNASVCPLRQVIFGPFGSYTLMKAALLGGQSVNSLQTTLELAKKNNRDNYGDIIATQHVIHFVDCADSGELKAEGRIGLALRLQFASVVSYFGRQMTRCIRPSPHRSNRLRITERCKS
jgi:hypothetical protein